MATAEQKKRRFWQRWTEISIKVDRSPEEIETKLNKKFSKTEQKVFTDKVKEMKDYDDSKVKKD